MRKCAYTWRACEALRTETGRAVSTYGLFKINFKDGRRSTKHEHVHEVQEHLGPPVLLLALDEMSLISLKHLLQLHESSESALARLITHPRSCDSVLGIVPFAGVHTIMCGDLLQHAPVSGLPLYQTPTSRHGLEAQNGRRVFLAFTKVHILQRQHRQTATADGARLQRYIEMYSGTRDVRIEEVAEM